MAGNRLLDQTVFFRYAQISMILCGIWPLKSENSCLKSFYGIYRMFVRVEMFCSLILGCPIALPYAFKLDKTLFSESLSYEIEYITLLLKVYIMESKSAQYLLREYLEVEEKLRDTQDPTTLKILEKNRKINVRLSLIYTVMICSAFVMFCELVYGTEVNWSEYKKTLNETVVPELVKRPPIIFSLPYLSGKLYYLGVISQLLGVIFVITYSIATQSMFFAYVTFTVSQIQVLKNSLRNFEKNLENYQENTLFSKEEYANNLMKTNIITHQNLKKYVKTLDGFFKYANLIDFLFYSLQIAATVNKILADIKNNDYSSVLFRTNYLCFNYLGLHFNYRSAHEIIFESSTLSMSLYESKWYEQSSKIHKNYLMMMMNMKNPLCLHIGPLYAMSNELLILIIKAAYSYVTLLRKSS